MKVLISMSEEFLNKIDALAKHEDRSRSELIREAVRYYEDNKVRKNRIANAASDAVADQILNLE